jgi:hypothetical protein
VGVDLGEGGMYGHEHCMGYICVCMYVCMCVGVLLCSHGLASNRIASIVPANPPWRECNG